MDIHSKPFQERIDRLFNIARLLGLAPGGPMHAPAAIEGGARGMFLIAQTASRKLLLCL